MIESIMACCEEKGYRTIVQNLRLYARWKESWYNNEEAYRSVLEPALQELRSIKVDGVIYVAGHARIIHFFPGGFFHAGGAGICLYECRMDSVCGD